MFDRKKTLPKILSLLHTRLGVDLTQYKEGTVQRRVARRMAALKVASPEGYLTLLRKDERELQFLFNDLFVQVTEFFRDSRAFDLLKGKFLANRFAEKGRQAFRIWVPACSTGEEVYSIAILCSELLNLKKKVQVQIFGTDINENNLEKARAGSYPESIRKQISPQRLSRYFDRLEEGGYRIKKSIRDVCVFARHDVTVDPPFSAMDLISCRNLLIYFQQPLQERLIPVFHYSLRSSGILFLGSSETIGRHSDLFELHDKRLKIFTKKEKSAGGSALDKFRNTTAPRFPRSIAADAPKLKAKYRLSEKSLHALVNKAVQENIGAEESVNIVPLSIPQSSDKIYLVFLDSSEAKRPAESKAQKSNGLTESASLRKELSASRHSLRQMSEQGDAVSEELRAANEEVISSNEELQSTNEELETAKEELQSINEELGALNHELKRRNLDLENTAAVSSQFTAIVDSSHDAIISKNLESIVLTWNAGATEIFGYTADEMVGKSITILIPENHYDEEPTILGRLRRGEKIDHYETIRRRKDGALIDVSLTVSPIRDASGTIVGASKIARNVTEQKRFERELQQTRDIAEKASRAKDQFLASLSHELRTPLNPVLLVASDSANDEKMSLEARSNFAFIRQNIEIEAKLIDDLLDLTRIGSGKLVLERKNIRIHELLKTTLQMLHGEIEAKKLTLKSKENTATGVVLGDPVRLQQIFWNVLKNAIKFTGPNGTVTVAAHTTKKEFKLVVTDTGIGMTKEELDRAFNAFRQESSPEMQRFGGLGLGLTIGKQLVELHQGTIQASSQGRNYGSTITITLPLIESSPDAGIQLLNAPTPSTLKTLPSWKILLVEDHEPTRNALAALLAKRKFLVQQSGSVSESILVAAKEHFDVVISDVGLPDGNGIDLFVNLRRFHPEIKGVALTGYGSQDDIDRSKEAGFNVHLTKPVNIQALELALNDLANPPAPQT